MGLIGLLITVLLMILASGYFLFGGSHGVTLTNDAPIPVLTEGISRYEDVKNQALDVKNLVEQKAVEDVSVESEQKIGKKREQGDITGEIKIINRLMTSGFAVASKPRMIDTIVLHSSYNLGSKDPYSASGVIQEYENYGVSAHYLIDRTGTIYRLVEDKNIAYHAGASRMSDGRKNVNDFSIGIEMINTSDGQYTPAQYESVNNLVVHLKKQYPIKFIVGHNDIAPDRKTDPWNFDWKRLK